MPSCDFISRTGCLNSGGIIFLEKAALCFCHFRNPRQGYASPLRALDWGLPEMAIKTCGICPKENLFALTDASDAISVTDMTTCVDIIYKTQKLESS